MAQTNEKLSALLGTAAELLEKAASAEQMRQDTGQVDQAPTYTVNLTDVRRVLNARTAS